MVRFPDVRRPRSFYDVFSVVALAVAIVALVLAVRYGPLVRLEMTLFVAIVFLWAYWAIDGILARSDDRTNRDRRSPRPGQRR